jgi:hypothetical protein
VSLHEKVHPVVALALHQKSDSEKMPRVLFVKYKDDAKFILPHDLVRTTEQPYKAVLRIGNTLFELGLEHVRVRCYYSNFVNLPSHDGQSLAVYYTLKLWTEEIELLDKVLSNLDDSRIYGYKWVSCDVADLDDEFDPEIAHSWKTLRKSVASNYGIKIRG